MGVSLNSSQAKYGRQMTVQNISAELSTILATIPSDVRVRMESEILAFGERFGVNGVDTLFIEPSPILAAVRQNMLIDILEIICRYRKVEALEPYYEIYMLSDSDIGFYSIGRIFNGVETRVPRKVSGTDTAAFLRKNGDVYIIRSSEEAQIWMLKWKTAALITCDVYDEYFLPMV